MSLILSGTDGLSDVDGTAATPAIRGTDTNTGIFFPAADTVAASVGGTEGLRLTTTGLGVGTSTPAQKLHVIGASLVGDATNGYVKSYVDSVKGYLQSLNAAQNAYRPLNLMGSTVGFENGSGNTLTFDSSGNLGLGVTPSANTLARTLELQSGFTMFGAYNLAYINGNSYFDGSSWRYKNSGTATRMELGDTGYRVFTAPSGTAGNAISFTQVLAIEGGKSLALENATSQTGTGITFPATQSASSNANTLDDYEEGTWTPALSGAGSPTYTENYGRYIKIGRLVTLVGKLAVTGVTSSANAIVVTGLPFSVQDAADSAQRACSFISGDVQNMGSYVASAALRTTSASLEGVRDNGSGSTVYWLYNELSSTSFEFNINVTYLATA